MADNNQAWVVGSDWEMPVPFIERRYKACATGTELCWASYNATISLNGHTSLLVQDSTFVWHPESDPGWKVVKVIPAVASSNSNGDFYGTSWVVTDPEGTRWVFGQEVYAAGAPATSSTLAVPVTATVSGQPCWLAAGHQCQLGWRWNLSHVVDANNNLQTWTWGKQVNSYA